MKNKKKNEILIVILCVIIICINNVSLSKYDYMSVGKSEIQMAKGIVDLEIDETIQKQIDKNSFPLEYNFSINNYNENFINEVDFNYTIEIKTSVMNFPVSYVLLDCDNNVEIKLSDGKSEMLKIDKFEKKSRKFKLYLQWRDIDGELAENVDLQLKVNAVQSKEEK